VDNADPSIETLSHFWSTVRKTRLDTQTLTDSELERALECNPLCAAKLCDQSADPEVGAAGYKELKRTVVWNSDNFSCDNTRPPITSANISYKVKLLDEKTRPTRAALRPTTPDARKIISEHTDQMLSNDIIERCSSPWCHAVILVKKKGTDTKRFAVDLRGINAASERSATPLPSMESSLQCLGGARWFSSFDMASAYWAIPIDKPSRKYLAFATHEGMFTFKRLCFGIASAPSFYTSFLNNDVLGAGGGGPKSGNLRYDCLVTWVDDVLCYSKTYAQHLKDIDRIMDRFRRFNLKLKASKCEFASTKVVFLSHVIDREGIRPDPAKIKAVTEMQRPRKINDLRSILGTVGYLRKFIPDYATKIAPLSVLIRKNGRLPEYTKWSKDQMAAWEFMIECLTGDQVMIHHPDFSVPFCLETDASDVGISAACVQIIDGRRRVIGYASRTLNDAQSRYSTYQKECFAIVWGAEVYRHLLQSSVGGWTCITDNRAATWLLQQTKTTMIKWVHILQEYKGMRIIHRPGKDNLVDFMSRLPLATGADDFKTRFIPELTAVDVTPTMAATATATAPMPTVSVDADQAIDHWYSRGALPQVCFAQDNHEERECLSVDPVFTATEELLPPKGALMPSVEVATQEPEAQTTTDKNIAPVESTTQVPKTKQNHKRKRTPYIPPDTIRTNAAEILLPVDTAGFAAHQRKDKTCLRIRTRMADKGVRGAQVNTRYFEHKDGTLRQHFYRPKRPAPNGRLVVPRTLVPSILRMHHGGPLPGHPGQNRLYVVLQTRYTWTGMRRDVRKWVASCSLCVRRKSPRPMRAGKHKVNRRFNSPFYQVHIDLVGPLPESFHGNVWILTMIDSTTRWPIAVALPNKKYETVAKAVYQHLICVHGCPRVLFSDNDLVFAGKVAKHLMERLGIVKIETTTNNPQSNGMLEVWHRWLAQQLTIALPRHKRSWCELIDAVLFAFRVSCSAGTGKSPFYLLYGREPLLPSDVAYGLCDTTERTTKEHLKDTATKLQQAYDEVRRHQQKLEIAIGKVNAKQRDVVYTKDQMVYIYEQEQLTAGVKKVIAQDRAARKGKDEDLSTPAPQEQPPSEEEVKAAFERERKAAARVSKKLMYRWSYGHTIVSKQSPVIYMVKHATRNAVTRVHVNRLHPVDPWAEDCPDSSVPPCRLFDDLVPFVQPPPEDLRVDDMVAVMMYRKEVNCSAFEIGKVLRITRATRSAGKARVITVHWFGNYSDKLTGTYRPGWQHGKAKQLRHEFSHKRPNKTVEFTNLHTGPEILTFDNILLHGFALTPADTLPVDVLRQLSANDNIEWHLPPVDSETSQF
jgi:hypothetical protein